MDPERVPLISEGHGNSQELVGNTTPRTSRKFSTAVGLVSVVAFAAAFISGSHQKKIDLASSSSPQSVETPERKTVSQTPNRYPGYSQNEGV